MTNSGARMRRRAISRSEVSESAIREYSCFSEHLFSPFLLFLLFFVLLLTLSFLFVLFLIFLFLFVLFTTLSFIFVLFPTLSFLFFLYLVLPLIPFLHCHLSYPLSSYPLFFLIFPHHLSTSLLHR